MRLTFVETPLFRSHSKGVVTDEELNTVQLELLRNPLRGALVAGTGGARKIRVATAGTGKRGGARVMYFYSRRSATVFLLLAYAKTESDDISVTGRKHLRKLVEILEQET